MGNIKKKIETKLASRVASYEATGKSRSQGFTKPGSQNRKKQLGNGGGGRGKRR